LDAYHQALVAAGRLAMIFIKTIKGKGISLVERKHGYYGKGFDQKDYERDLDELSTVDKSIRVRTLKPDVIKLEEVASQVLEPIYHPFGESIATGMIAAMR